MSSRIHARIPLPAARAARLALLLSLAAASSCARPALVPGSLVAGGTSSCGGRRYVEVSNPLDRDVDVYVRLGDGRQIVLRPGLQPREDRNYELPGTMAVIEVYGLAEPVMKSSRAIPVSPSRVNVQPAMSCHGFLVPASGS